jgi:hypothetical protein
MNVTRAVTIAAVAPVKEPRITVTRASGIRGMERQMVNHPNRSQAFQIPVSRKLVNDLLGHFGPDPVTRGWCHEAIKQAGRWLFVEVKDENKEPTGTNLRRHVLTDEKIEAGLKAFTSNGYGRVGDLFDDNQHDAPLADLFVQCCLFGEEKYA